MYTVDGVGANSSGRSWTSFVYGATVPDPATWLARQREQFLKFVGNYVGHYASVDEEYLGDGVYVRRLPSGAYVGLALGSGARVERLVGWRLVAADGGLRPIGVQDSWQFVGALKGRLPASRVLRAWERRQSDVVQRVRARRLAREVA